MKTGSATVVWWNGEALILVKISGKEMHHTTKPLLSHRFIQLTLLASHSALVSLK